MNDEVSYCTDGSWFAYLGCRSNLPCISFCRCCAGSSSAWLRHSPILKGKKGQKMKRLLILCGVALAVLLIVVPSMGMYASLTVRGLLTTAPYLVAWIVAIIVAVIMVRRGRGTAERLLLAGVSLMLVTSIMTCLSATLVPSMLVPWLAEKGMSQLDMLPVFLGIDILKGLIGIVGIFCLIYAFWIRFKARSTAGLTPKD